MNDPKPRKPRNLAPYLGAVIGLIVITFGFSLAAGEAAKPVLFASGGALMLISIAVPAIQSIRNRQMEPADSTFTSSEKDSAIQINKPEAQGSSETSITS